MEKVELEHMRPEEILLRKKEKSIAYLPIGPLEWHTPALPYGTDPLIAHYIACKSAEKTGGVVLPAMFLGSDCPRPKWHLKKLGFENTDQYIVGMDFPHNMTKSFYLPAEVVAIVVMEYVRLLVDMGYKMVVVVNAHGAATQSKLINEICQEFTAKTASVVLDGMAAMMPEKAEDVNHSIGGHANRSEASMIKKVSPEDVDTSRLPAKPQKLKYSEIGIVDRCVLFGDVKSDGYVINDPRDATAELGDRLLNGMISTLSQNVNKIYQERI
jgi:creatinine amidohydrolase